MTNEEIAGWMVRNMGPEAATILQAANRAYDDWRAEFPTGSFAARRATLELHIIVHGGLPAIERMRHAV